jgi:hypothetical protein
MAQPIPVLLLHYLKNVTISKLALGTQHPENYFSHADLI